VSGLKRMIIRCELVRKKIRASWKSWVCFEQRKI